MGLNRRCHQRILRETRMKIVSKQHAIVRVMRDFSESGSFLFCADNLFQLNEEVTVQNLDVDDAPIVASRVVRIERNHGFAVEFAA